MPLYEHKLTGKQAVLTAEQAAVYPDGIWTKVADESVTEKRERERLEAQERKVDNDTDEEAKATPPSPKAASKSSKSGKGDK